MTMQIGTLKILGRANSFNVRKVLWACEEIGISFEREDYGRGHRPTNTPEFLKLNPTGQVPVVIDDGIVMRESNSIVRYLAAKHRAENFFPKISIGARLSNSGWIGSLMMSLTRCVGLFSAAS